MKNCLAAYPSSMYPAGSYEGPQAAKISPARKALCIITGREATQCQIEIKKSPSAPSGGPNK